MTNELSPWFQKILQCLLSFGLCMKNDGDVNSRLIDTGDGQFLSYLQHSQPKYAKYMVHYDSMGSY